MAEYHFRKLTPKDEPLFHDWLSQPHIDGWWQDGVTEWALVAEDFDNPAIDMRIVALDQHPFAYIQDYDAHAYDMPQYVDLPAGTRAIDTFLGDARFQGSGHGAAYIGQRIRALRRQFPLVCTDPDTANARAIAAYAKAGFHKRHLALSEDGAPVQVMTYN